MWKEVKDGLEVFVENGYVVRATKQDMPASVYRWNRQVNAWINACPVKYETFRKGYREGRYEIK